MKNSITSPSEGFLCRSSHYSTQLNKGYISIQFSSPRGFSLFRAISLLFRFSCSFHHLSVSPTLGGFLSWGANASLLGFSFLSPADSTYIPPSGNRFRRKSARVSGSAQYQTTDTCTRLHLGFSFPFQLSTSISLRTRSIILEKKKYKNTKNILLFNFAFILSYV